jgi:amidohydrolase
VTDSEGLKKELIADVDSMRSKLVAISDKIHGLAEIGHQEFETSKLLSSELEKAGFRVEKPVCGLATAFKATIQGKERNGPTVALLVEMDALEGIGHGCGHNIIGTASLGAALALKKIMPQINGTLIVYGTPAEEGGVENAGGKVIMASEIAKNADVAMMVHPAGKTIVEATSMAREALEFEFFGKAAHAGGSPHEGINALNAVIHFFTLVDSLRQHVKTDVRLHGIITDGGKATNVVPDHAAAKMYVRAKEKQYMEEVVQKVKKCAEGAAIGTGTTMKVRDYANTLENMLPNHALAETMKRNWEKIGVKVGEREEDRGGSTDMGNVSQVVPSIHPYISIGPETMPGHSTEFVKAAVSERGHQGLIYAAKGLAMTTIDVFTNQDLLAEIKREFKEKAKPVH